MILIFGGTTEGRKAVKVCDQAGNPFFYATKGNSQKVESANAISITGGLNSDEMITFCKTNNIELIINAAHPFAEVLHKNITTASEQLNIPVIRYERSYAKRYDDILWFDSYQQATDFLLRNQHQKILALTGVNTINKLKKLWQNTFCYFRILDRDDSRGIAQKNNFPEHQLLFYNPDENERLLFETLKPDAIITKESGESGGFTKKLNAARDLKIPFLVIKRPKLSDKFISVYGENGLRKEIQHHINSFFKLKTGYTTGTCATAATKAALESLFSKEPIDKVSITLPNGEWVVIPIAEVNQNNQYATATVIKDAGDDPDVTNGLEIKSTVSINQKHAKVHFLQGEGVGKITLPGIGLPIGEPAVNKTPRRMITREIFKVLRHHQDQLPNRKLNTGIDVTISVPKGREIAKKTYNPKIGIVDGISIIGTSGVVKPFSSQAFVAAIYREMQVAKALNVKHIVINSGAKSETFLKKHYPKFISQAFIHYGNFIGETLKAADKIKFPKVSIGIMIGKAVKLADGHLDTHSRKVVMNKPFLIEIATKTKCSEAVKEQIKNLNMARELWTIIPDKTHDFYQIIIKTCKNVCQPLLNYADLEVLLIDDNGAIMTLNN